MSQADEVTMPRHSDSARGSFTVELVVLTPIITLFILITLAFGRYALAQEQVVGAARAAADAAAVAASASQAPEAALAAALPVVQSNHTCTDPTVIVDSQSFAPGTSIRVSVSCRVTFADLSIPGIPGSATMQAVQTAAIDPYRTFQP